MTNVCGQPNVLEIRSHVSHAGDRVPASSSQNVETYREYTWEHGVHTDGDLTGLFRE